MPTRSDVVDIAPPARIEDGGGGGGWAWLVTARGIIEAELIKGVLEAAGILPVVFDARDPTPGAWMYLSGNVNRLVRIFVPASMLDSARLELLECGFALPDATEPVPAPPAPSRSGRLRLLLWIVAALLILAAMLIATFHASVT